MKRSTLEDTPDQHHVFIMNWEETFMTNFRPDYCVLVLHKNESRNV